MILKLAIVLKVSNTAHDMMRSIPAQLPRAPEQR